MSPTLPTTPPAKWTPLQRILAEQERSGGWLARKCGVSSATMNRWIRGIDKLPEPRRRQIADTLGVRPNAF